MLALRVLEWILQMWLPLCPDTWIITEAQTLINLALYEPANIWQLDASQVNAH